MLQKNVESQIKLVPFCNFSEIFISSKNQFQVVTDYYTVGLII